MNLSKFRNIHKGKRAFLTACGPSLNDIDVSLLDNEIVYGVSKAYLKKDLKIDYHFIGDMQIASQISSEITSKVLFTSHGIYKSRVLNHPNMYFFLGHGDPRFYKDPNQRIYGGGTSTFLAMQFAYYMGIHKLYVIGLDHYESLADYNLIYKRVHGSPLVENTGLDTAHFDDKYYDTDTRYYLPDANKMAKSYYLSKIAYEEDGREIYNASTKTALSSNILPRINFKEIFNGS